MLCEILNAKPLKQQKLPLFLCYENIKGKNFFFIVYSLIKKIRLCQRITETLSGETANMTSFLE